MKISLYHWLSLIVEYQIQLDWIIKHNYILYYQLQFNTDLWTETILRLWEQQGYKKKKCYMSNNKQSPHANDY